MSILNEVLKWTEGLPGWQSDAVARLLTKQTLDQNDLEDLFALLKTNHGIPDPKGRTPKKLNAAQIPAPIATSTHVELRAMKNMLNVNAIAKNCILPFGASGVTVIYGDNGSGKSGYSRVLKRACRARDQMEAIHPNANLPPDKIGTAKADFEVVINGNPQDIHWINGNPSPAELSALAVFDSRCARAYLDNEDDFSYIPYGLDVFENLATVCNRLKAMVESEQGLLSVDRTVFAHLLGETQVGKMIAGISSKTSTDQIETLTNLSPEELAKHVELGNSLKENNPKEKANQLRLRARRIAIIATNAVNKGAIIDKKVVDELRGLADSYRVAQAAAQLAAQQFTEGESLLPGTGSEAWRELFEAARKFATESHPGKTFPALGVDAPCPLCQQPLTEGAARLIRFEAFIQQEAEKASRAHRAALDAKYKPFIAQDLSLNLDDVTYGEIEALDQQLAIDTRFFEQVMTTRQAAIKVALASNHWDDVADDILNPAARLQVLAERLNHEAETLEKASDEKLRASLKLQFDELDARVRLSQVKAAVVTCVERLNYQEKLKKCLAALNTKSISLKAAELNEKVVSKALADALNQEYNRLGVDNLKITISSRSEKGKALHKLKIELAQGKKPSEILSEGEQRAIAIGSFLAEISLSGGSGGLVFDDPVSSLDHVRREKVAYRLALEGSNRQIIIFTHDLVFLLLLQEYCDVLSIPIMPQILTKHGMEFGIPVSGLPWYGQTLKKRIAWLRTEAINLKKIETTSTQEIFEKEAAYLWGRLRETWECGVEEVLLNGTIRRFSRKVSTQQLVKVSDITQPDIDAVETGMTICSTWLSGHDSAAPINGPMPTASVFEAAVENLETWRSQIEKRRK